MTKKNTMPLKLWFDSAEEMKILTNKDYRERLIENGYLNAEKYNSKKISKKYLSLYKELHSLK